MGESADAPEDPEVDFCCFGLFDTTSAEDALTAVSLRFETTINDCLFLLFILHLISLLFFTWSFSGKLEEVVRCTKHKRPERRNEYGLN